MRITLKQLTRQEEMTLVIKAKAGDGARKLLAKDADRKSPKFLVRKKWQLILKAKDGDAARNNVVMGFYPLIAREGNKIADQLNKSAEDIIQVGVTKILKEFHRLDPARGMRASTFLMVVASREMRRFASTRCRLIDVPANIVTDEHRACEEKTKHIASLNVMISNEFGQPVEIGDLIADPSSVDPNMKSELTEISEALHRSINRLNQRFKIVLLMRMEGKKFSEIGEYFGITRQASEQINSKALQSLAKELSVQTEKPRHPLE